MEGGGLKQQRGCIGLGCQRGGRNIGELYSALAAIGASIYPALHGMDYTYMN